jgi:hypothetical protein
VIAENKLKKAKEKRQVVVWSAEVLFDKIGKVWYKRESYILSFPCDGSKNLVLDEDSPCEANGNLEKGEKLKKQKHHREHRKNNK